MAARDRRAQLVAIGLDLLETRPIHEFALDEVAAVAGVSRTLVFHYFPSKSDYYAAVVQSAGERLLTVAAYEDEEDVPTRLRDMVRGFLRLVSRKRGAYVALVRGASGGDPKVLALLDDLRSALVGRWLDAARWPIRGGLTDVAVRGWLGALEEVALTVDASAAPRESVVELLAEGLLADLERAQRISSVADSGTDAELATRFGPAVAVGPNLAAGLSTEGGLASEAVLEGGPGARRAVGTGRRSGSAARPGPAAQVVSGRAGDGAG